MTAMTQNRQEDRVTGDGRLEQLARMPVRLRERLRQLLKLNEAQAVLGWSVILVLFALLGTIYLVQASRVAETGRRMQVMQIDLADVKRENGVLEQAIAESQSLTRLQREAIRMGFVLASPTDIEYVIVPDYPAALPEPAPTAVPRPRPFESMEEALWVTIGSRFSDLRRGSSHER